jgi:hypothetical protein
MFWDSSQTWLSFALFIFAQYYLYPDNPALYAMYDQRTEDKISPSPRKTHSRGYGAQMVNLVKIIEFHLKLVNL